ncbi:MAG TPA: class A beta-lactamase [Beijerinckiaceae bacterium]|nr:class A beta-lactamase [Beijerinckiaceae bacterium]
MTSAITRRGVLLGAAMLTPLSAHGESRTNRRKARAANRRLAAIEAHLGGRLGVLAIDTQTGLRIAHRTDERFPLCSTFKFLAVAAILERVDRGKERLDRWITYDRSDLQSYAPITKAHVDEGGMSLADICAAALDWSDNTAANLLLGLLGGPQGVTRYARSIGDAITRLDRTEPTLNAATPSDARDTTSPTAMVRDMNLLLLGTRLSESSRAQIESWMAADQVSAKRLRAGLPADWRIGDKTRSGDHGTANTIAIMRPPSRAPILAAVYLTNCPAPDAARDSAHAEIGRLIAETF